MTEEEGKDSLLVTMVLRTISNRYGCVVFSPLPVKPETCAAFSPNAHVRARTHTSELHKGKELVSLAKD